MEIFSKLVRIKSQFIFFKSDKFLLFLKNMKLCQNFKNNFIFYFEECQKTIKKTANPTTGRGDGMRNDERIPSSNQNEEKAPNPKIFIERYRPVYVISGSNRDTTLCPVCRNQLDQACAKCLSEGTTDPNSCHIVEGKCGHKFHCHCLYG